MELEAASRQAQLVRMDDQDRVSQTSSVATISYFPVIKESDGKVQAFGKRCQAAKRDPNCPVVIRGWLNKKDSSGLKLWKRRWFVLSNYCLFYYKDSREESVFGSIPLPSYKILFCTPRECKNRKFTFKVVHQGMRSYYFSADTQEDMLGWVRALSQSAAMEPDSSMNRRCSSYQDFTQLGGSSESVNFPKSPSDGEGPSQKHRHVSRTLSEPGQLSGGRMGTSHSEQRGRRSVRQRNSSPSNRTPSPPEFSRRRTCGPDQEEDSLPGQNTPPTQTEIMGTGYLSSRGQLGSRPHTPVGRVDIRPHDDPVIVPQTLYYAPPSPKLEFKSTPNTPVSERWQNLSKPTPTYGSVHHIPCERRPLGKSYATGAHADLLPPLPPLSRATHAPHHPHHHHHHHHHRNHLSVCVLPPATASKPDSRETPPIRPLQSGADAVLTRLCGCDKLLQSLSVELAQLQMDKDSVQCALEVSRLQLEDWQSQGPRAQEEALTQKALLQEELVTIRARMCDVSLEMERVWSQYERMESELSVIRSHLQHICNFGIPQEQSQAQRELWMMEDILAGLKVNREHFRFLLGPQRHHMFQPAAPHPGSPGSPTERLQSGLPMDAAQEPPVRPALPQELQESQQSRDQGHGYTESPYEGIYSHTIDPTHRRGSSQPDLLNVKAQRDASESQSGSKWNPPDTTNQSTKKMKMSEEEQIERMKRNQERLTNRKKPPIPTPGAQSQSSETREEAPFPLRVTRVVTAVLPSSLVARRVSVEDPPAELDTPLPEQIPPEMQQRLAEQSKMLNKPPRRLLPESPDQNRSWAEMHQNQPVKRTSRQQHLGVLRSSMKESRPDMSRGESTETSRNQVRDHAGLGNGRLSSDIRVEEQPPALLTPDMDPDLCLTPEQREAKLRRVERIRERVIRSAARESVTTHNQLPIRGEGQEVHQVPPNTARKQRMKSDNENKPSYDGCGDCEDNTRSPAEPRLSIGTSQDEEQRDGHVKKSQSQVKFGDKTQHKDHSGRTGVARTKIKCPASPYHISSMTVYQKDGGKGFVSYKVKEEKKLEEPAADDSESNFPSSNLRTKWFLSTNQWQGFIPLQKPGIDSLCNEEIRDIEQLPTCTDDGTDSTEMSPTVCESLEKMKENHSLFYKIACDISISDTDITKNDGNTDVQMSCRPEEEEKLLIAESARDDATSNAGRSPDQESKDSSLRLPSDVDQNTFSTDNKLQDSTLETRDKVALNTSASPAKETRVYVEIKHKECEATSRQESLLKVKETNHGTPAQDADSSQALDECAKTKGEHSWVKESEESKVDQGRSEELKKSSSSSEENKETVQKRGENNSVTPLRSVYEAGSMIRRASFGKARVTVLRTSL
ncbi:pleckstrin homology domain-containing family A member 6-like isoform X2 [Xiphias gladius]|uniref:pleckstrin homology domain-containing family A member 6-like isoform X2 n=1 Tax=Xiphias gladius TaxID=8245 RepID=UPI001A998183|nr:pleckstrin homology domain-containing family A member 6-like isoform X2 [Xiphias gladius]